LLRAIRKKNSQITNICRKLPLKNADSCKNPRANYETVTRQTTKFRVSRKGVGQYEAQLYDFILDERDAFRCVTGCLIRLEALRLLPGTNFQLALILLQLRLLFQQVNMLMI
jgi:hypothetical protein